MVRFRAYEVIIVWDLEKAYNLILTGDQEFFHRLVVWRFGDTNAKWRIYGLTRVHYGDRPAAVLLELAKELAAQEGASICPIAAQKSNEASYMDDSLTGGSPEELDELVGNVSKDSDGKPV